MKNKLQQMLMVTLVFIIALLIVYFLFGNFLFLTFFIEMVSILTSGYLIFVDKRASASKFAWLFAILFFPYIGILLFFLVGNNPISRRFSKTQKQNEQLLLTTVQQLFLEYPALIDESYDLSKELGFLTGNKPLKGNQLLSIADGEAAYQSMLADIQAATHHIHIMYFIYKADETGRELADLLIRKAKEGVNVRFMYDSVGSIKLPYEFLRELQQAEIAVRVYDLVNSPLLSTRINWRNHRKMVVIDGQIAYIGGMNLANEYRSLTNKFAYWRDTNLRIVGPAASEVQAAFLLDWIFLNENPQALQPFLADLSAYFPLQNFPDTTASETCQIVIGGPYDSERILRDSFMEMFGKATKSIRIASPYFVPDEESLSVIRRAARCGLQVQVIIPGKGDRPISYYGNNAFIDRLLSAGVEVYAYDSASFLHCKYMLVDDLVAVIGSTNFDIRSFNLNHEISAFMYGPSSAVSAVCQQFAEDVRRSIRLTCQTQAERTTITRVKERISELFAPLL